jgi:hypothetical protein
MAHTLAVLLVGVPGVAFKIAAAPHGSIPVDIEERRTDPPIERTEHHVSRVTLASRWADCDFLFSATVKWYPRVPPGSDPVRLPPELIGPGRMAREINAPALRAAPGSSRADHFAGSVIR